LHLVVAHGAFHFLFLPVYQPTKWISLTILQWHRIYKI
jgi:hypothetical protein